MSKEQQTFLFDETPALPEAEASGGGDSNAPTTPNDHLPVHERHGPLTDLIDFNFLQYASYVICERAIPNVADGLKPVQRRILHALKEKDDGRFIKVANVVGHTMQYHPHGDASIGDALVTLTNKRYLIEGQGNFGNIFTGDQAAASRYIECRLNQLARDELFNKDLTNFIPSYDGRNQEPVTLPSKLPLLLMLGAEGIAVGLSTHILPHNFIELLEAEIQIIQERKKAPVEINVMPDFQTGGVMDVSEYDKGFGKIKVRARIEKQGSNKLLIKELPCMQTTEAVISSIEEAVKKKKVPVRSISDFTAEKVEIEIALSVGANQDKAIKALYAFTKCETSVSSRIIVICNKRPVEMNTEQVLRMNVSQLLDILQRELALKKHNLLAAFHNKTLIQIFVENRIYKQIEECKTYEAVIKAVFEGLKPFRSKLKRNVTREDVEMLLGVRIKRISRFDIEKNRKDIEAILKELAEVEKNLKNLKSYAVDYLKTLIKTYKNAYPRYTKIDTFKALDVRKLTSNELSINIDSEKGFLGHSVKGEELLKCSSLDKLLIVKKDGTFVVMPPPETYYINDILVWCGIYKRELAFTAVYTDWGVTYIKRFEIGGVIMNRDYDYIPKKAQLQLCQISTPEAIYVKYKPVKGLRIHQQEFKPEQVLIKGVKAKGKQMTSKIIARIDTRAGRWWDKKIRSPKGILF
ncbi:MAG: DNA topoisomerase IV subunit A [Planctomycetes bacterium]|nr:DNA topoisomerase IV subunit A [Planctomycetota bacterium]MBL7142864.1 DNA topoisomerase IV subunit A [Phycisphaerae bacterium]